ncbi:MAG: hypothetical protein BGO67_05200 [Alphaproteobacteria bacterium 41-28]|nr:MAG: hypothetical protein BGO67_05200 [Alphaproteobacteria bacterium 41-28]
MLPINVNRCSDSDSILIELSSFLNTASNSLRKMPYYVCKITQVGCNPVIGLVNLINYQDFHSKIIPHEHVYKDKINDYVQQFITGNILNNPILLFYKNFSEFQHFISQLVHSLDQINVQCINGITYEIFPVNNCETVEMLQNYLGKIPKFYIADGHHRIYALSKIRAQSTAAFSQHYLSFVVQEDDLKLGSFNRFIKGVNLNTEHFIKQLRQKYIIKQVSKEELNCETNVYIYTSDIWYQLDLKKQAFSSKFTQVPSVHIDKFVISLLASSSPLTSKVLYSPGTDRVDDIRQFHEKNQCQVAINIPKISRHELFSITEEACRLPPHSTYFTPKIPNDLFIQKLNLQPINMEDTLI